MDRLKKRKIFLISNIIQNAEGIQTAQRFPSVKFSCNLAIFFINRPSIWYTSVRRQRTRPIQGTKASTLSRYFSLQLRGKESTSRYWFSRATSFQVSQWRQVTNSQQTGGCKTGKDHEKYLEILVKCLEQLVPFLNILQGAFQKCLLPFLTNCNI